MSDFTNFNPQPKPNKRSKGIKKPIAKRSKKNKPIDKESKKHLLLIKCLPCIACGSFNRVEAHHIVESYKRLGKKEGKEHYYTIPLCFQHHEGQFYSVGNDKKNFITAFGAERELLEKTWKLLNFDKSRLL
jgi:hypothetical protein